MSIRVGISKEGAEHEAKAAVIKLGDDGGWKSLEQAAANKLRMKRVGGCVWKEKRGAATDRHVLAWGSSALSTLGQDKQLVLSESAPTPISSGEASEQQAGTEPACCSVPATVIADESNVDDEAVKQLEAVSSLLAGVRSAVGLPDLHPGRGFPVGAAIACEKLVHPELVGGDIGCGMLLVPTSIRRKAAEKDARREKWAAALRGSDLDEPMAPDKLDALLGERGSTNPFVRSHGKALGTVGSGNHFAELQAVDEILDDDKARAIGIDPDTIYLVVHSGSRGLGSDILDGYLKTKPNSHAGLTEGTDACDAYLQRHDEAVDWARLNRRLIAARFLEAIGEDTAGEPLLDICHNSVVKQGYRLASGPDGGVEEAQLFLHRKGAAPANEGLVIIPGSRGHHSFLMAPDAAVATEVCGFSLAHGAGREQSRSDALAKGLKSRVTAESLTHTDLSSVVVCNDETLLYEEAPTAYKPIYAVVNDLSARGLACPVVKFAPVLTFKTAVQKSLSKKTRKLVASCR
ncbi:tRNA-splicing ligase RtcB [Diplonema papillatum]|nr:tRNA-splicing ligase RtcB [Diplonema papillatum]